MRQEMVSQDSARKELELHPEVVVAATTTFYPEWHSDRLQGETVDSVRGDLALELVQAVVASKHFIEYLQGRADSGILG